MDVFNSALRNPLPPLRKKLERRKPTESDIPPAASPVAVHNIEDDNRRKKKTSRRKHRNSHLGCGTCKKRRIKCDENLPQCFNCVKGKLHCAYLNLDAPARNALRMAQYNQHLRQDRHEDQANKSSKEPDSGDEVYKDAPPGPSAIPVDPQYYQGYAQYQMIPPHSAVMANGVHPPITGPPGLITSSGSGAPAVQQPRMIQHGMDGPAGATFIQSPYGPMVLFQHVAGVPGYQPMAVQVMQGPPGPQMVYQGPEHVPVQFRHQPVHMTHASIDGQPVLFMQNAPVDHNISFDGATGPQLGFSPNPAPVVAQGAQGGPIGIPASYPGPGGRYLASLPLHPPPPPALASVSQPTSAPTLANGVLTSFGALSNSASLQTSPQLPVIRAALSTQLAGSVSDSKTDLAELKLPPIKTESASTLNSVKTTPKVTNKVPSILKLLS